MLRKPIVKYSIDPVFEKEHPIDLSPETWFDMWTDGFAVNTNSWYKNMPPTVRGVYNHATEIFDAMRGQREPNKEMDLNIRSCPPVREYLSRSLIIKAPNDFDVATAWFDDKDIIEGHKNFNGKRHTKKCYIHPSEQSMGFSSQHQPSAFTNLKSSLFKDHFNVKWQTPLVLELPKGVDCTFQPAFFNDPNPVFKQIPGVFEHDKGYAKVVSVIWNVMIPNTVDRFSIKAGDPLMYIVFSKQVHQKFQYKAATNKIFKRRFYKPALPLGSKT